MLATMFLMATAAGMVQQPLPMPEDFTPHELVHRWDGYYRVRCLDLGCTKRNFLLVVPLRSLVPVTSDNSHQEKPYNYSRVMARMEAPQEAGVSDAGPQHAVVKYPGEEEPLQHSFDTRPDALVGTHGPRWADWVSAGLLGVSGFKDVASTFSCKNMDQAVTFATAADGSQVGTVWTCQEGKRFYAGFVQDGVYETSVVYGVIDTAVWVAAHYARKCSKWYIRIPIGYLTVLGVSGWQTKAALGNLQAIREQRNRLK